MKKEGSKGGSKEGKSMARHESCASLRCSKEDGGKTLRMPDRKIQKDCEARSVDPRRLTQGSERKELKSAKERAGWIEEY